MRHGRWRDTFRIRRGGWLGLLAVTLIAGAMAAHAAAPEAAATLKWADGVVLIGDGSGFSRAREGMPLHAGDRIMVTEDARALLVFPDGCEARLDENTLLNLRGSGCTDQAAGARRFGPHYAAAIGSVETPSKTDVEPSQTEGEAKDEQKNERKKSRLKDFALPAMLTGVGVAMFAAFGSGDSSSGFDNPGIRTNLSPQ